MLVLVIFPKNAQHQPAAPAEGHQKANPGDAAARCFSSKQEKALEMRMPSSLATISSTCAHGNGLTLSCQRASAFNRVLAGGRAGWPAVGRICSRPARWASIPKMASRPGGSSHRTAVRSAFPAKAAHHIDEKANHQNEAEPASADGGSTKIKTASAEQEQEYNNQ